MDYKKPEVVDYGTVEELTAKLGVGGREDGGTKAFHTTKP